MAKQKNVWCRIITLKNGEDVDKIVVGCDFESVHAEIKLGLSDRQKRDDLFDNYTVAQATKIYGILKKAIK